MHINLTYNIQEVGEAAVATDQNISMFAIDSNSTQIQKGLLAYLHWQSALMAVSLHSFLLFQSHIKHLLPKPLGHLCFLVAYANWF